MGTKTDNSGSTISLSILLFLMSLGRVLRYYGLDRVLGGRDENEIFMYYVYTPPFSRSSPPFMITTIIYFIR